MSLLSKVLGIAAGAFIRDAISKPKQVAHLARAYSQRVGKPMINVGAGAAESSLKHFVLGPTYWGDVNIDRFGDRDAQHGRDRVTYGTPYNLREWPDKHFGSLLAVNVLETLRWPDLALLEWRRVADKVFVVTPSWWSPYTWLDPDNRWYIDNSLGKAYPLWTDREQIVLLPSSDPSYSPPPWAPPNLPSPTGQQHPNMETMSPTRPQSPSSSPSQSPNGPTTSEGTGASSSPSLLTVVSSSDRSSF